MTATGSLLSGNACQKAVSARASTAIKGRFGIVVLQRRIYDHEEGPRTILTGAAERMIIRLLRYFSGMTGGGEFALLAGRLGYTDFAWRTSRNLNTNSRAGFFSPRLCEIWFISFWHLAKIVGIEMGGAARAWGLRRHCAAIAAIAVPFGAIRVHALGLIPCAGYFAWPVELCRAEGFFAPLPRSNGERR